MAGNKKDVKKSSKTKVNQKKIKEGLSDRVKAIILFAIAVLILAIMIVPGAKAWKAMHNFMYGVFGICGFAVVVFLAAIAYRFEKGESKKYSRARLWCVGITIVLLQALIHVIFMMVNGYDDFKIGISEAFNGYWQGVIGALIGGLFILIIGETGSLILLIIAILALVFIFTGLTLSAASKAIKKPIDKIKNKKLLDIPKDDAEQDELQKPSKKKQIDFPLNFPEDDVPVQEEVENKKTKEKKTKDLDDAPIYYFDDLKEEKDNSKSGEFSEFEKFITE